MHDARTPSIPQSDQAEKAFNPTAKIRASSDEIVTLRQCNCLTAARCVSRSCVPSALLRCQREPATVDVAATRVALGVPLDADQRTSLDRFDDAVRGPGARHEAGRDGGDGLA